MDNLLFIYGTLLIKNNEYGMHLRDNASFYASGRLKGKLYDIGEYPGAVLSIDSNDHIHGYILKMDSPEKVLPVIDDYEGFGEHQPQPNEFVRVLTEIETDAGPVHCWIYLYNLPVSGLRLIENGRYTK